MCLKSEIGYTLVNGIKKNYRWFSHRTHLLICCMKTLRIKYGIDNFIIKCYSHFLVHININTGSFALWSHPDENETCSNVVFAFIVIWCERILVIQDLLLDDLFIFSVFMRSQRLMNLGNIPCMSMSFLSSSICVDASLLNVLLSKETCTLNKRWANTTTTQVDFCYFVNLNYQIIN